jgi:hypothetical protein
LGGAEREQLMRRTWFAPAQCLRWGQPCRQSAQWRRHRPKLVLCWTRLYCAAPAQKECLSDSRVWSRPPDRCRFLPWKIRIKVSARRTRTNDVEAGKDRRILGGPGDGIAGSGGDGQRQDGGEPRVGAGAQVAAQGKRSLEAPGTGRQDVAQLGSEAVGADP